MGKHIYREWKDIPKELHPRARILTDEKPHTYDEIYQAYKRKWLGLEEYEITMPHPEEFLYTKRKDDMDIAYDEMLKYLDDTEITAPKTATLKEKDMSDSDDEYRLDDGDDRDMVASKDREGEPEGLEALFGDKEDTPDEGYIHDAYSVRKDYAELFG